MLLGFSVTSKLRRLWVSITVQALLMLALLLCMVPVETSAQNETETFEAEYEPPIRTDSPRETMTTFLRLAADMETALLIYLDKPSFEGMAQITLLSDQMVALFDLDAVSLSTRREAGIRSYTYLMDIFGRIGAPDMSAIPDAESAKASEDVAFRVPGTPLRIVSMHTGDRTGEYLFSATTEQAAFRFFRAVRHLPLQSALDIESFTEFGPQLTGPLFPPGLVETVPEFLRFLWLDTPAWKVMTIAVFFAVMLAVVKHLHRFLSERAPAHRLQGLFVRAMVPLALLLATFVIMPFLSHQVNVSGRFARIVHSTDFVLGHFAFAWMFWLGTRALFEWVIRSPKILDESLDANLLRLVSGVIGIVGGTVILAFGGQAIGLPIMSVLAGLGIGGLAVALALRPTLENLIGGVILYVDRPVRIGDFCSFGDMTGTVEEIGIRSIKVRALDRTLISVPNAQFADMQIVNWAECDQMLINETIGVRYETTPDQLRYLLAQMRRMFHAHPRIDSNTVRVRFIGFGESALNINVRVYVATQEWNDFFSIREDVFLRISDIVAKAGAQIAFPSQTLYMARDRAPDGELGSAAELEVQNWRESGQLPFPRLSQTELEALESTLDYPPRGSTEASGEQLSAVPGAEPLSGSLEPMPELAETMPKTDDTPNRPT